MPPPPAKAKFFLSVFNHIRLTEYFGHSAGCDRFPQNGPNSASVFAEIALHTAQKEPYSRGRHLPQGESEVMNRDNGFFGIIIGGIVAVAAAIFIFSGGELGGKKTVEGDQDLPPIATAER